MPRTFTALISVLIASPSFAQAFYRWVDAEGTTHYTDNSASIPKGATVFATEGEPISMMGKPGPVPVVAAKPSVEQKQVNAEPAVPTSSEQFWRSQFRNAKEKIRTLEDEIAADRHRVEDVNGMPASVSYSCTPSYGGFAPQVVYGSAIAVGPQGAQAYFGPVGQAGYAGHNTCVQVINAEYDRTRRRLEKNRSALARAKDELHELERQAAFEAVPLEWRR